MAQDLAASGVEPRPDERRPVEECQGRPAKSTRRRTGVRWPGITKPEEMSVAAWLRGKKVLL